MTKVQRYKVGYYTDEWGMSSNTPCLVPDDSGYPIEMVLSKDKFLFGTKGALAAMAKGEQG